MKTPDIRGAIYRYGEAAIDMGRALATSNSVGYAQEQLRQARADLDKAVEALLKPQAQKEQP